MKTIELIKSLIVQTGDVTRQALPSMHSDFLLVSFCTGSELAWKAIEHIEKMEEAGTEIEDLLMQLYNNENNIKGEKEN